MSAEWWPYGIAANRAAVETFARYQVEQDIADHAYACEEVFAPETWKD